MRRATWTDAFRLKTHRRGADQALWAATVKPEQVGSSTGIRCRFGR